MFKGWRQWFVPARDVVDPAHRTAAGSVAKSESVSASASNPFVQVSVTDLVALRRYAGQINLDRLIRSRANSIGGESSRFRGRGMDYQESRAYQAGDDIRNMDWRVTARAGRPHVKVYEEERERPVFFLVDFRPGMFFASRGALKSVVAARLAALLGWAAADRGDRIGALIIGETDTELRPVRGKRGVLMLIKQLVTHSDPDKGLGRATSSARLTEALARMNRIVRPGALVFIISDFHDFDEQVGKVLGSLSQHADVVALRPFDILEKQPPPSDRYAVTDGGNLQTLDLSGSAEAQAYAEHFRKHEEAVRSMLERRRIAKIEFATDEDIVRRLGAVSTGTGPALAASANSGLIA